jgi:ribosomal protein S18 acetylase RimI-like enzyme/2'-5' RNA ligase
MIGIISLLTDEAYLEVQRVQRWLEEEYGLPKLAFFQPHITYLIGEGDGDREAVIERTRALASETDLITILTKGLGIFPGAGPEPDLVLYLPVPRSSKLAAVHQALCQTFVGAGETIQPYYRPESWLPHVTLASKGPSPEVVSAVVEGLPAQPFSLTCRLAGLRLVEEMGDEQAAITHEFPFRGQNELGPNPFGLISRPCQPSDRDFIYRLVEEALRPLVSAYFPWDEAQFERNWSQSWHKKVIVLAEDRPVGYIQYDVSPVDSMYIGGLFLAPAARRRGWGEWLLTTMEGAAPGRPVRLHVWENNPAVRFYTKHGYRVIGAEGHKVLMEKARTR